MLSYAILIDGGFAKRKLWDKIEKKVTNESLLKLVDEISKSTYLEGGRLHRVYFYDSEPLATKATNPVTGENIDFSTTDVYKDSVEFLKNIQSNPYWALRKGDLQMNGWTLARSPRSRDVVDQSITITARDIKANISQKGVDMKIGLDMAALSLKEHVDVIVLVSGDSDLIPAMKFARIEGRQLYLVPLKHPIKDAMMYHSDVIIEINPQSLIS